MDKPIQVGDLVVIYKPPFDRCCNGGVGTIFKVTKIRHRRAAANGLSRQGCFFCGDQIVTARGGDCLLAEGVKASVGMPLNRLKRIPPLGELEGEKRDEEITA